MLPSRAIILRKRQLGLTYLWVLFVVTLLSLGLGKTLEIHHQQMQREKEAELLYVGEQYRKAIRSFYYSSPGMEKRLPGTLEDLLQDKRLITRQRHIRRLYPDPITGDSDWGLVHSPRGGIMGIYSLSKSPPIKQHAFPNQLKELELAERYEQWQFTFTPRQENLPTREPPPL